MTKVQQIRREFNEPFRDVVAGFALMGYSRRSTAEILEINRDYFFKTLLPLYAPDAPWKSRKDMRDDCKRKQGGGWPKGAKRPKAVSDHELLAILRLYPETIGPDKYDYQRAARNHPWSSTFIRRFGSWTNAKMLAHTRREL